MQEQSEILTMTVSTNSLLLYKLIKKTIVLLTHNSQLFLFTKSDLHLSLP